VSQPLQQTVMSYLDETGTTEAVERVEVRARVTGFLEQVNFEPGADVKQGEVLYVIEQPPFVAARKAAEAEREAAQVVLDRAEIEYGRQLKLQERKATSDTDVVAARAERDAARAAVAGAEAALDQAKIEEEYTEVEAPISGRVGKTLVKVGNLVDKAEATHLTTIVSYDPIYANFNISERALLKLREQRDRKTGEIKKETVRMFLARANDSGFPFQGNFDYADLAVDQSTGTYSVRGIFPNPDLEIVPGLFVRIRVPIGEQENALLVPETALGADQAGRYLLVVNSKNVVERRNVTVGSKHRAVDLKYGHMVVIEEGLRADDRVVIEGLQRGRPGREVTAEPVELPALEDELAVVQEEDVAPDKRGSTAPAEPQTAAPPGDEPTP
jgi:RND family efflux transporter MFP subunit